MMQLNIAATNRAAVLLDMINDLDLFCAFVDETNFYFTNRWNDPVITDELIEFYDFMKRKSSYQKGESV